MKGGGDLRRTLRLFGRFTYGDRRVFAYAAVALAVVASTAVAVPNLLQLLTDYLANHERPRVLGFTPPDDLTVLLIAVGIVGATAVNSSSESLADIFLATAARTLGFNLRGALFAHLQRLPLAFHLRRGTGDVLTRLTGDVKAMEDFVEDSVSDLLGSTLILGATMAVLFGKSWQIALLALAIVPLLSVISTVFARRIKSASKQLRASEGELASTAQEMLSTISLVQVYGRGDVEERKFQRQSGSARDAFLRTSRLDAVFSFTVAVLESLGIAVVILVGARLVKSEALTAGALVAFILLIQNMFKPVRRIIKQWNKVASVYASVERVGELLDLRPTVVDTPDAGQAPPLRGEIEFRDVSFAYHSLTPDDPDGAEARLALQSVSFRIAVNEVVALVGHSGAGKSTIAQLLPRLYDPHAGAVLIDGHDIRRFTVDSLRSQISMVLQETLLLRGTIAENIAYGRDGATSEDVVTAAKQAAAHDFIMALPEGYDTVLGERASTLSGGQRQRLSVARAFIRNAPILILDEPTTGLDAESAALVAESLKTLARNRSTLIVSHDFNLIRSVDRVLVMSAGRILQEGSPDDLLASGGLYADLYARQFGEAVAAAGGALAGAAVGGTAVDGAPVDGTAVDFPLVGTGPKRSDLAGAELAGAESAGAGAGAASAEPAWAGRFDTVLREVVPRPASPEEFHALTGWLPAPRRPAQGEDGLDALRSPAVTRALPGLSEALTGSAMAPRLRSMLAGDWELLACSPGKAYVEPGEGATLQYRLELRQQGAAETVEHVVAGRLFPTVADAEAWLQSVHPLVDELGDREDVRSFSDPTLLVRELRLVLHAFPLDPVLPGLVLATDPTGLVEMVGPLLTGSVPGLLLRGCRVEVVRYNRGGCVLRYELSWSLQPSRRSLKQVMYGTVYAGGEGRLVGPAVTALRQHLADSSGAALPFLAPRFQAYLPDLHLALLEAVPGSPLLPELIRARVGVAAAPPVPGTSPEKAVAACARIAAAMHESSIPVGPSRTLGEEVEAIRAGVDDLTPLAPRLAASLHRHLGGIADLALDPPGVLGVAHGDFRPSRVLFDGPSASLVNFDRVCLAEPALDLGQFTGHLSVAVRKAQTAAGRTPDGAEELGSTFLHEYLRLTGASDPEVLLARVAAYRTVALARLAVRSWCQLKPDRLRLTLALLDEPQRIRVS
jgi:ABC-type multidrug transport system fused ATPase/permease subunit